jgi:hypothetical protein
MIARSECRVVNDYRICTNENRIDLGSKLTNPSSSCCTGDRGRPATCSSNPAIKAHCSFNGHKWTSGYLDVRPCSINQRCLLSEHASYNRDAGAR